MGDARRSRRVLQLAAGWAQQPGATIPQLGAGQAGASKGAYRLLGRAPVSPAALQAPHRALVQQAGRAAGTFLLIEDTTELSWPKAWRRGLAALTGARCGWLPMCAGGMRAWPGRSYGRW